MAFKQMLLSAQPQARQLVRINPSHWLARDLIFAHTGYKGFVFGEPAEPLLPDLLPKHRSNLTATAVNSPFAAAACWSGNGTNFLEYLTGGHSTVNGLTLGAWVCRIGAISVADNLLCLSSGSTSDGAFSLRLTTAAAVNASSITAAGVASNASVGVATSVSTWHHGIARLSTNLAKSAFMDGGNKDTQTTATVVGATHTRITLAARRSATGNPIATSQLAGFAFPVVFSRVLSDAEFARLYNEQLENPWTLFAERPIWVPVSASTGAPTLSALSAINVTASSAQPRITYTF